MKTILVLGAGGYQYTAIVKAKALGCEVVVVSNDSNDYSVTYADVFENCSTINCEDVLAVAINYKIDGVFTIASEIASVTTAQIAKELKLYWPSVNVVNTISNKDEFNKLINKKAYQLGDQLDYPVIVKPKVASGSSGISLVNSEFELKIALQKVR